MVIPDKQSLAAKPRVFISYSRKDGEDFAKDLRTKLEARRIPLWQDRVGMEGGKDWWLQITEALDKVEFMVLVMTPEAMESPIIRKEWRYARQKGVCVYPTKGVTDEQLDYKALPRWMRSAHFYDLEYEWDKFINDLNTRCQELRVPFMVEDLPENFVQRTDEFNELIDQLLDAEREEPLAITTALRGAGGYGKTTLAMALCHDERILEAYDDGILWVTLGEEPGDLTEKIKNLIEILSGKRPRFTDKDTAAAHLSELLADRDILIVIDDAWNSSHIQPFLRGGPRCSRLITTRNSDTLPTESKQNILDAMQADEARSLLGYKLPATEQNELQNLAHRLGEWPILLRMVNAFLIERVVNRAQSLSSAIAYIIKRLDKYGILAFDTRDSDDRYQAVDATLSVSLEMLGEEDKQRFAELAIFPEDIDIPLEATEKLWIHAGFDELDTEDLCERLFQLSLLQHFDPNIRVIRLHDVIRSYLREKNKQQLIHIHDRFLDAYGVAQWYDLPPSEPYLWKHLAYHLADGKQAVKLHDLLCDYHWIRQKLAFYDVNALLADYNYLTEDKEMALIQGTLRLSANQITQNLNQLTPHLIGRLKDQALRGIEKLLQNAIEAQKGTWFCPIFCSLTPPGDSLIRTLEGHEGSVSSVALSADGKTALSGSDDKTLKLWDLGSGQVIKTLEGHSGSVNSVALSADGKTALSGSYDKTLKLWDLGSGQVLKTLKGHEASVRSVALSADGKTALSASYDKTLKLWDLGSGQVIKTLRGHFNWVSSVALSADGKTALSASYDKTLKLWDLGSGQVIKTLEGHSCVATSVALSADGKSALSISNGHTFVLWDLGTGKAIKTLEGHGSLVTSVVLSADGKTALSGSYDKTLKLWDLGSGKVIKSIEGHSDSVNSVALSADGKTVLSGSDDKTLKLWDLGTGKAIKTLKGHGGLGLLSNSVNSVTSVALSADGKTALSGSGHALNHWDLGTGKLIKILKGHEALVSSVALSADGKTALSGSFDKNLKLWDLGAGKLLITLENEYGSSVKSVALSADGKTALSGLSSNTLKFWDLSTGKAIITLEGHGGLINSVNSVALSADGKTALSGSDDKTLKLWDLGSGQVIKTLEGHSGSVNSVALSADGKTALSGSDDKTLKLWDLGSGKVITSFIGDTQIMSVAVASSRKIVVSGDSSGRLHFFRIKGKD